MGVVAGDVVRTTIGFTLNDGTIAQNIFHHKRTGIGIITDAVIVSTIADWAEAMYAEIIVHIPSSVSNNLSSVDKVEFVDSKWTIVENIGTFVLVFAPTSNEGPLPNQSSAFVTLKTARPKSVGRKFLTPFVELAQDGTFLIPAVVEDIVAWADDAVNDIVIQLGDNLVPGIVRTGFDVFLEFTVAVVTNVLGSQRRRRPGVGA